MLSIPEAVEVGDNKNNLPLILDAAR